MKTTSKNWRFGCIALICACLTCVAFADDQKDTSQSSQPDNNYESTAGVPPKCNRGNGIIGMEVRNQDGDHLGHIRDLVVDLKTEKVSYAVMSTSPKGFSFNEKLLAVPLSAFTPSADDKHLILNADKEKVASAAGFDKKNWPSVTSPSWGAEPFWQNDQGNRSIDQDKHLDKNAPKPGQTPDYPNTPPENK